MWLALRNQRVKLHLFSGFVAPRSAPKRPARALTAPTPSPLDALFSRRELGPPTDLTIAPSPGPASSRSVEVSGVFQTVDAKHENLVIANLDSGVGVVPVARVRWSDVLSITTEADEDRAQAATGCG